VVVGSVVVGRVMEGPGWPSEAQGSVVGRVMEGPGWPSEAQGSVVDARFRGVETTVPGGALPTPHLPNRLSIICGIAELLKRKCCFYQLDVQEQTSYPIIFPCYFPLSC